MIDFEQKFKEYIQSRIVNLNEREIDILVPKLYMSWLDTPADWLDSKSPNAYFSQMEAAELIKNLGEYLLAGVNAPGPLLCSIADRNKQTYPLLVSLLINYDGEREDALKYAIVRLIEEMDFKHPYAYYIDVIKTADEANDFTEICAEELKNAGQQYFDESFKAYKEVNTPYAADCFLDILCDMPFDERVYDCVLERFLYCEDGKAFYASLLGKLGEEKAIPYLSDALRLEGIKYYDYIAVKNALEALGSENDIERDFSGDKDYEKLAELGDDN
ncbi:MAG: hypothetical protein WDA65_05980 [Christensenellales bacterium]